MKIEINTSAGGANILAAAIRGQIKAIRDHMARTLTEEPNWDCAGYLGAVGLLEGQLFQVENAIEERLQAESV